MANSEMWNRLEKTDPSHTKQFSGKGGFKGTAINGTYILKRLTEEFGPCGKGWKFVMDDERYEDGHVLKSGDKAKVHIVRGHLYYMLDGVWYSTSPQFGQTMLVSEDSRGTHTDEEAPKKSITDCISKCAVLIGIGADVHLGLFDDNKYVNQRRKEEAEDGNAPDAPTPSPPNGSMAPPAPDKKAAANLWASNAITALPGFPDLAALEEWHKPNRDKIASVRQYNEALHKRLVEAIDKRRGDFNPLSG